MKKNCKPSVPPKKILWALPESSSDSHATIEQRKTFNCPGCCKIYSLSKLYQIYCSEECEQKIEKEMNDTIEKKLNSSCIKCGLFLRKRTESKSGVLCEGCKQQNKYKHEEKRSINRRLNQGNMSKRKTRNNVSYGELIRRSEYDRVFKDSGWTHYIKGRKWDKI
jgi:hypothetical protein